MRFDMCSLSRFVCVDLRRRPFKRATDAPPRTVLCLGNFDGVHVAHAELLRRGMSLAQVLTETRGEPVSCGVLCFFHPTSDYFVPDTRHLTILRKKLTLFAELGIEYAYLGDFSDVRAVPAEDFLARLEEEIGCVGVVCGFNHRFGKDARGDAVLLTDHFGEDAVCILPEIQMDGITVSSSAVRDALLRGDAAFAARLLGHPYSLTAIVTSGKQLGRTIGFPTANQYFHAESLVPLHGVYAALVRTPDGIFPAVANVGRRPTVADDSRVNCESYIIGYQGDLYGRRIKTELLTYLRPERRFSDVNALRDAIARDADAAARYIEKNRLLNN